MEYSSSTNQDYDLWILLMQVKNAIFKAREKELSRYGLRPGRAGVLHVVHTMGATATLTDLSHSLLRERHSISELVGRMEKEGLVRKVKDRDRKNRIKVGMTKKGQRGRAPAVEVVPGETA